MSIFKDKTLLITGGTGSFGNAVLRRFLDSDIREIRIFSRDEKKASQAAEPQGQVLHRQRAQQAVRGHRHARRGLRVFRRRS